METMNFKNYRIERDEKMIRDQVRPVARVFRQNPKGRYSKEKMVFGYFYGSIEQREKAITDFIQRIVDLENEKEERKQAKKDAKANMVNPFKIGDIVYDSWGYDQTNIDFYEVVEVNSKSVKIREIGQTMTTKEGYSSMSGFVSAVKGDFIGELVTKILQVLSDGKIYIRSRHGWISPWDGQPKYMSWYA